MIFFLLFPLLMLAACGEPPSHSQRLSSPIATPFGAAGIPDVPPRPTQSPPVWYGFGAKFEPPARSWRVASDATSELSAEVPSLDRIPGSELRPVFSSSPCPELVRTFAVDDLAVVYEAVKAGLDLAGFARVFDYGLPLDGRYREGGGIFLAEKPSLEARISAGRYDPQMWAEGTRVARPYVLRLSVRQRCQP